MDSKEGWNSKKTKRVVWAVVAVVIVAAAAYVFYDLNGHSFSLCDRQVLVIATSSMDGDVTEYEIDSFPANTLIMIEKFDTYEEKMELKVGDVISFKVGTLLDHHRIIQDHLDQGFVITQGDNAPYTETVYIGSINGKVIGTNHPLGLLVDFVHHNVILLIFVLIAALAVVEYWQWMKKGSKKK
ncbi:MAG: hypothetical protein IJ856_00790 [Candidatus Methanomethylophilaceae archaeon]|nr:hypothetical protein [Candidatus Methanomethylophilaceae archaeon]